MADASDETGPDLSDPDQLRAAAIDITTCWGVDSLSDFPLSDPWAEECFVNLIDVLINHTSVTVPLPSKQAGDAMELRELPAAIVEARRRDLLSLKTNAFAESVELAEDTLASEYDRFRERCLQEPTHIRQWVHFARETPRIVGQHQRHVPSRVVDAFWPRRPQDGLERCLRISEDYLNYAFDVYARTIQYHEVLEGEAWYFRHPFRKNAIARRDRVWSIRCTTWGSALLEGMRQGFIRNRLPDLMEMVASLRGGSAELNWYTLASDTDERRVEAMQGIAASCGLPGKVRESVLQILRIGLGAVAVVSSPLSLGVGVIFGLGALAATEWKGTLPRAACRAPILQGIIERPYLPKLRKSSNTVA